ncbi:MAG: hypothetical protein GXP29_08670 [Planctomycetes bacterium]|nr:hypothetical protein [Planctomycetota bacterium]
MALCISTRALGKRKRLLDDFSVPPPEDWGDGDDLRLRDVIEHVVRCEVKQFHRRERNRQFERVLSQSQIVDATARGKVDPAVKEKKQSVDTEEAIGNALQSFEDGVYLVIIDDVERRSLDEVVHLKDDSRLTFVRLTFLAGA